MTSVINQYHIVWIKLLSTFLSISWWIDYFISSFLTFLGINCQATLTNSLHGHLSRCVSSLCSLYQLSEKVIRSSPKTHFQVERPNLPLRDERDVKRHVKLEVDHNCDPQRCGPVIEDTLADTQLPRWFTMSWWFSQLHDFGVRDKRSLCCHSFRWMRREWSWKGVKPGV